MLIPIRRRFIRVQGRGIHYLRAGDGPPVVLLHSAMSSACGELPLMHRLASDHTVFAFDNPGMGDSDPLPKRDAQVADAANTLNATLMVLKMPRCPVYGSHTGGAVALELARRHPERVSALIMEGVTVFGAWETKFFLSEDYMPPFPAIKNDGSHLFANWIKARDHFMWFPWSKRTTKNRVLWPFPPSDTVHAMFLEILRAGAAYRVLYGAVFKLDVRKAVAGLTVPATFVAAAHDPLFRHLDRLPRLKANQRIVRYSADGVDPVGETARVLRGYRVKAKASADAPFRPTPGVINRRYVDLVGGQILVRSAGEARNGRPLLLLHDGRASSRVFEPLMRALARRRAVYAPDLPDNGASDSLAVRRPGIADYADAVADTVVALRVGPCDIYAVGASGAVALELLARRIFAKARVLLETPDFYTSSFARRLAREWVPPLKPQWDGAHLNRLWLMLRDEYAFWPWFDKSSTAACAVNVPTEWQEMHARVTDIMRSLPTYHRLTMAALRYDWTTALRRAGRRGVRLVATADDPRRPPTQAAARLTRLPEVAILPTAAEGKAGEVLRILGARRKHA